MNAKLKSQSDCQCEAGTELRRALDKVLAHEETLKDTISWPTMDNTERLTTTEIVRLKSLLRDIQALAEITAGLSRPVEPACSDSGNAAAKVFAVPELLEGILMHLPIVDLLKAEDTSSTFRNTVAQSPRLCQKLFRTSTTSQPLRSLGYVEPFDLEDQWLGYSISCFSGLDEPQAGYRFPLPLSYNIQFKALFQSTTGELPPLRNKVLDMYISQPPVVLAGFATHCCNTRTWASPLTSRSEPGRGYNRIRRAGGIKLRDIYVVAKGLLREHRLCRHAPRSILNDKGAIKNRVIIFGQFCHEGLDIGNSVKESDPAWIPFREKARRKEALEGSLNAYMAAKIAVTWKVIMALRLTKHTVRAAGQANVSIFMLPSSEHPPPYTFPGQIIPTNMTDPNLNNHTTKDNHDEVASAVSTVLAHRDKLQDMIGRPIMSRLGQSQESDRRELKSLLADIEALRILRHQSHVTLLGATSESVIGLAVAGVFKVPELLENILQHLTIPELHNAEDTCRRFRDTIASSPKLPQKLFRTSVTSHRLRTLGYVGPFNKTNAWLGYPISVFSSLTRPDFYCPCDPETFLVRFNARFQSCTGTLPQLPDRVLEMFVSQPPITQAQISLACCGKMPLNIDTYGNYIYTLRNPNGFKLKDLYAVASKFLEEHKLCPGAHRGQLNKDGFVQNTATFMGQYLDHGPTTRSPVDGNMYYGCIPANDPAWSPHVRYRKQTKEERAVMIAYMAAKIHAYQNRQPMFTLEEFKARTAARPVNEEATKSERGSGE
ncbi:hypothetical protein LTR56_001466 [Elasticomyces elasticus]|nr:hypothetical protein LTR56_001466 [Elasticomyces elasticus]